MLQGKKILIGITGSIAAYKTVYLIRLLKKAGAEVRVITTSSALDFIGPLTLSTLSENPVYSQFVKNELGEWTNHVELGLWADLFVIAPLTAKSLSSLANGYSNDLLSCTYLSCKAPVMIAPAMDLDMWTHSATQRNLEIVKNDKVSVIEPGTGSLASGLEGKGRMAEPEEILAAISDFFGTTIDFKDQTVLITAGPTFENIDPVRFIGNYSSGKMGIAIAEAFYNYGANVKLILGPVSIKVDSKPNFEIFNVRSAQQMHDQCTLLWEQTDIAVMSAAVADYRPETVADQKIKKKDENLNITLVKNPDILASLGAAKKPNQYLCGFALETENELANAQEKLRRKNADLIILNSLATPGAGFQSDLNEVSFISANGKEKEISLRAKQEIADSIVHFIYEKRSK